MKITTLLTLLGFWASLAISAPFKPSSRRSPFFKRISSVPYGTVIENCSVPGTVAITFDDGPSIYTGQVLDELKSNGVPATFFVNGENWSDITSATDGSLIKRMIAEGHQIGSHTWNHADLTTLDYNGIVSEMTQLSNALKTILGPSYSPQYMRPPYFAVNDFVLQTLGNLGYHVIDASIDTLDYANDSQTLIQNAVVNFISGLGAGGTIALSHDVHQWTANVLVQAMIDQVKSRGLKPVTIGECLGDPPGQWYRS